MTEFSKQSLQKLSSCHADLQALFKEVIQYFDCVILEGFRDEEAQNKAFFEGKSKLKWPNGNHNKNPSYAVDVAPYPIDFSDIKRIYYFAGRVLGIADMLKKEGRISHSIRYGGDWNGDTQIRKNTFNDLVHYEII